MNYGGFWIRLVAYIIDSAIVVIAFVAIMMLLAVMGLELAGAQFIFVVLAILYFALMQSSKRQATLGKALCGLKVGGPNGERISVGRALGREAAKIISALTFYIGFIIAAFTGKKQALHDFVATTYVVRDAPGKVMAAVALAVLILFSPAIAVVVLGAAVLTSALGPMAALLEEPKTQVVVQQPAPQPPKPVAATPGTAAPAAPAAPAAATPPKPAAEAPKPAPVVVAAAPKAPAEPPKSAPAPLKQPATEPAKPAAAKPLEVPPAPVAAAPAAAAEEPAKAEPAPKESAAVVIRTVAQEAPAAEPRVRTAALAPAVESKIRFNDLVTAVLFRDAQAVNELLAFGKWPDKADSSGMTPLMIAAQLGETEIAQALLKAGADPKRTGPGGVTAMSLARERKDAAMLGLLQESR
jgi:uncharacterized RDD family membrane protein YckC